MNKLAKSDLLSLEQYALRRDPMRSKIMQHKQQRRLAIGAWVNLYFEDRFTMHYQVQEMLRAERIFEAEGIQQELDAYNPLIPDGTNLKATMMIEITDVEQRRSALKNLVGVEQRVYLQVNELPQVWAIADEDMERADEEKTSAVHFLRFELSAEMIALWKANASLYAGVEHHNYKQHIELPERLGKALLDDFD